VADFVSILKNATIGDAVRSDEQVC
jgi:hypothetical protein